MLLFPTVAARMHAATVGNRSIHWAGTAQLLSNTTKESWMPEQEPDVIVIGGGLAGLVATAELVAAGKRVTLLEQEPEASLGGQAWWSFGGLFLIDSPEQRRMGITDSLELARNDWFGSAGFDRVEDNWPRQWAEAYLQFAATEKRSWLKDRGVSFFPVVGWAERGGYTATGHGNSVPRFHITWGTGPGVVAPFEKAVRASDLVTLKFRHRVDELVVENGAVVGARGAIIAPDAAARGEASNRDEIAGFDLRAGAVIVTSGGIGGNHAQVRKQWPARMGEPPTHMLSGVPAHVDGRMLDISERAGANLINGDRMWHYVEGIENFDPVWASHGIRILPGPSSLWLDATGKRLPVPLFPGFDTLGTLEYLRTTGHDHSWFILTQAIIEKEFALSGSEQNPDLTGKSVRELLRQRLGKGATGPVEAFKAKGADFIVADTIDELLAGIDDGVFDRELARHEIDARDRQLDNEFTKDAQINAIRQARHYRGDKLIRVAKPHKLLAPAKGPLIAVKLHIVTRKSLGGIETNLDGKAIGADGAPIPGLYAAGEASGFGGGGMHGYRSLEGTFLGGCLFSGRQAGRSAGRL
jgi:predicted oxidoreductase